ncbi:MAG: hypothetical protein RSA79_00965 [Oscillospiraceae bacterium]
MKIIPEFITTDIENNAEEITDFIMDNMENFEFCDNSVDDGEPENLDLTENIINAKEEEIESLQVAVNVISNIKNVEFCDVSVDDGEPDEEDFEIDDDEEIDEMNLLEILNDNAMIIKEELMQLNFSEPDEEIAS